MAASPVGIAIAVGTSATDLYTAGANVPASLVTLDLTNTTNADIRVDVWKELSGPTSVYLGSTITVPAKGNASFRGMDTVVNNGDKWRAQATAAGVDANGTVLESV